MRHRLRKYLGSRLKRVKARNGRRIISHRLIDLSDAAMELRVAKYVKKYFWLARKENRFAYTASDGYMDFGLFDAYDENVKDYADYIRDNDLVAKDYARGLSINAHHSATRTKQLRKKIKASTRVVCKLRKLK